MQFGTGLRTSQSWLSTDWNDTSTSTSTMTIDIMAKQCSGPCTRHITVHVMRQIRVYSMWIAVGDVLWSAWQGQVEWRIITVTWQPPHWIANMCKGSRLMNITTAMLLLLLLMTSCVFSWATDKTWQRPVTPQQHLLQHFISHYNQCWWVSIIRASWYIYQVSSITDTFEVYQYHQSICSVCAQLKYFMILWA